MSEGTQSDFQQLNPVFEDDGQFKLTFKLLGSNIGLQNLYYIFAERQIYPILILSAMANNLSPCEILVWDELMASNSECIKLMRQNIEYIVFVLF